MDTLGLQTKLYCGETNARKETFNAVDSIP